MKINYSAKTTFYYNNIIKNISFFKNDQENGKCFYWYENGQIEFYGNYVDCKLEGEVKRWFMNGKLSIHYFYKNDEYDGEYIRYSLDHHIHYVIKHLIYEDGIVVKQIRLPLFSIIINILKAISMLL